MRPDDLERRVMCLMHAEVESLIKRARAKRPRFETLLSRVGAQDTSGTAEGARRLRLFWDNIKAIEGSFLTLSKQQRHIIEEFVRSCVIKIVGQANFEHNPPFFMKETGKETQECLSIVITPRRFGKTTATAMFVAAVLLTVPDVVVAIFSTGRRASAMLLAKIHQIVNGVPGDQKRILACNQETLKVRGLGVQDIRTCHSYPSNLATLKGVGCDIGIMEEFTRCDPAVWQEVVVPLLGVNGTAIVAISTPLGEDNWYTSLIQKKTEDGERLFNVVQYSLVCDECRRKGIATECSHMIDLLPPWKSESRQRLVKFLLSDSSDLYLTEAMGEISSSNSRCFTEDLINQWILRPVTHPVSVNRSGFVFVAVDPTSGIRSELAIVSLYFDQNQRLVVREKGRPRMPQGCATGPAWVACKRERTCFFDTFVRAATARLLGANRLGEAQKVAFAALTTACFRSPNASVSYPSPLHCTCTTILHLTICSHSPSCFCKMKVCGLDSESIGDAEVDKQNQLVSRHMAGLVRKFRDQRIRFVSLIEGNMSWVVANQLALVMNRVPQPILHACKDESCKVVGVSTTEDVKINMVNTTRALMQQKRILLMKDLVCEGRRRGLEGEAKCTSVARLLGEQLKRLQQRVKSARDIFGKAKAKITGKVGSHQDDLCIAFLLCVHWATAHASANKLHLKKL